jgi:hypothetical protein
MSFPSPSARLSTLAWLLVGLGLVLRMRQFAEFPSLWMDEAMLAVNVVERSFRELLAPLEYNQGAPLGFLFLQKVAYLLFGPGDAALRVVPMVAACAALPIFASLAISWLGAGGLVAVALMALSNPLVDYAVEAKQYAVDVLVVVALWRVGLPWLQARAGGRDFLVLAAAGALAVWCSHPAVFALSGLGLVVACDTVARRDIRSWTMSAGVLAAWSVSLAAAHSVSLAGLAANTALLDYWQAYFLPWRDAEAGRWLLGALGGGLRDAAGFRQFGAAGALACLGSLSLLWRTPRVAVLVLAPVAVALVASALRLYPFAQRLLLFAAPIAFVLVAAGIAEAARLASRLHGKLGPAVLVGLALLVLVEPARSAVELARHPQHGENLRPALEHLLSRREPGDGVYVYYGAKPAFRFYSRLYPLAVEGLVLGRAHRSDPASYLTELAPLRSRPRGWLVVSHVCPVCSVDEKSYLLDALDRMGRRVDSFETTGAGVYLFEFATP